MTAAKRPRDPIFALIAAHAKAVKAHHRSRELFQRLFDRIDARPDEKLKNYNRRLTCSTPYFYIGPKNDPHYVITSREQIKTHVFRAFDDLRGKIGRRTNNKIAKYEREAIAELLRHYDRFQREHRAKRKAVGITARFDAVQKTEQVAHQALKALIATYPTTVKGTAAMVKHFATLGPADAPLWVMKAVMELLTRAVPSGLPQAPVAK
jgi:hypothetical protein